MNAAQISQVRNAAVTAALREIGQAFGTTWARLVLEQGDGLSRLDCAAEKVSELFTQKIEEMASAFRKEGGASVQAILAFQAGSVEGVRQVFEKSDNSFLAIVLAVLTPPQQMEIN